MPPAFDKSSSPPVVTIDRDEIRRIAGLTRLRLTPEEEEGLITHLHTMLSNVKKLDEVTINDIDPLTHAAEIHTPLRTDQVTNQPNPEVLLQNAPARVGDLFVVPRIIE